MEFRFFDIILVIIHGFPSFLLVGVQGEAGLCPKLELLLQGGYVRRLDFARLGFVPGWPGWALCQVGQVGLCQVGPGWGFVPGCQVGFARLAPG